MGYWRSNEEGHSFRGKLTWGDDPADEMDNAIANIVDIFERDLERKPTKAEIIAGVRFSLGTYKNDDDEVG